MGSTNGRNSRCESNRVRMYAKRFSGSPLSASGACANSHNAAEHSRMCSSNSPIRIRSDRKQRSGGVMECWSIGVMSYETELRNKNRGYMKLIVWQKAMELFELVWAIVFT